MSYGLIATNAIRSFEDFIVETSTAELGLFVHIEPTCLAHYIYAWAKSGRGVRVCQGDFQTFTLAIIAIINAWLKDPGILDYIENVPDSEEDRHVERRVTSIFGDTSDEFHRLILDRDFFAICTFWELHGPRDRLDPLPIY